jgi:presenilin-like A22 family membrane protease
VGSREPVGRFPAKSAALAVAFVVVIQLCALVFTYFVAPVTIPSGVSYAPGGTTVAGSASSAIALVIGAFATTLVAVWLIKKKRANVFTWVIFVATSLALFLMTLLTTSTVAAYFLDANSAVALSLVLASAVTIVFAFVTRVPKFYIVAPLITGLLSAEVGSIFASTIPFLTALLLVAVFSVYDIYAVFRGPLKQLVTLAPSQTLTAVTSRIGDFTLGTGDTIFYSMLPAIALLQTATAASATFEFNIPFALVTMVAIDVGVVITLYLLSRSRMLPGLPIPMALGLLTLLALTFL